MRNGNISVLDPMSTDLVETLLDQMLGDDRFQNILRKNLIQGNSSPELGYEIHDLAETMVERIRELQREEEAESCAQGGNLSRFA